MDPYADITYADAYFAERLNTSAWDNSTTADKTKALIMGTRIIDRLNFLGCKTDSDQENQFPRGGDTEIPDDIKIANCEIALSLLDGIDIDLEFENLNMVNMVFDKTRAEYDRNAAPEHIVAGVPSLVAWRYIRPYIRDPRAITIDRVN